MIAFNTPVEYHTDIITKTLELKWVPFQPINTPISAPVTIRAKGVTIQKKPRI